MWQRVVPKTGLLEIYESYTAFKAGLSAMTTRKICQSDAERAERQEYLRKWAEETGFRSPSSYLKHLEGATRPAKPKPLPTTPKAPPKPVQPVLGPLEGFMVSENFVAFWVRPGLGCPLVWTLKAEFPTLGPVYMHGHATDYADAIRGATHCLGKGQWRKDRRG